MKTFHITLEVVVAVKSKQKADKLAGRMLDAVEDDTIEAIAFVTRGGKR